MQRTEQTPVIFRWTKKAWISGKQPERKKDSERERGGTINGGQPPPLRHGLLDRWSSVGSDVAQRWTHQLSQPGFLPVNHSDLFIVQTQFHSCQDTGVCITQGENGVNWLICLPVVSFLRRCQPLFQSWHRKDYFKLLWFSCLRSASLGKHTLLSSSDR